MTYSSTGQAVNKREMSTSPNIPKNNVIFHPFNEKALFQKNLKSTDEFKKEELTKEEEDKFYKKVFKTSIL